MRVLLLLTSDESSSATLVSTWLVLVPCVVPCRFPGPKVTMWDEEKQTNDHHKVGPAITHAKFRVDSPVELRAFLWQLVS